MGNIDNEHFQDCSSSWGWKMVALIEPVFSGPSPTPGPIAGVGLPALAIIGGAYWLGRKLLSR